MANKKFTAREMDRLRESPYVLDVTQSIVHFSAQFKALFYEGLQAGKGFRDLNTYGTYLEHLMTPEAKIRLLEQELAYKDQIIEYLKKIVSLGQAETK